MGFTGLFGVYLKKEFFMVQTREFFIHKDYLNSLMRSGCKRIFEWYPAENLGNDIYDRIGMHIGFEDAESILLKYRKNGIGPDEVSRIMAEGEIIV